MNEQTTQVVDRLLAAVNAHDADAVAALMADDVLFWEPTFPEPRTGREAVREEMRGFFAMLPDIRFEYEAVAGAGNVVFCEFGYRATYAGRPIMLRECSVTRLSTDGRVSELRVYFDRLTLLRQLGLAVE